LSLNNNNNVMNSVKMTSTVSEVGTEILYAITMTVSPHRVKNICD